MCRVAIRQAPRQRPRELKEEPVNILYDQLNQFHGQPGILNVKLDEDEIDFENLFEDDDEPALETGELDLLALFSDDNASPTETQLQQANVAGSAPSVSVQTATALPAVAPLQAAPGAQTVQQLQLQALLQQQMAAQQQQQQQQQSYAAAAAAAATSISQDMTQLQQMQAAQMQAMLAAQASLRAGQQVNKRGKTQAEVEEQQERIKKRRRESAQRSRARKNSYMKTLEVENKALKMENERLRMELMKMSHKTGSASSSKPDTPSQHMMSDHSEGLSMSDDEMCNKSGISMPATANFFQLVL